MNDKKLRSVNENDTKVYNCTFELHLHELRILLKFPCKFFIEWKTVNGTKSVKTEGLNECINGRVLFNQSLSIETEMLYNVNHKQWLRKISTISVYLITRNKPDFNQLAGRINIDLSQVMENNPFEQVLTESLTHASTNADLKFSLEAKYSLQSSRKIHEIDLLEFSDRLLYVGKGNDQMNKSKSMGYLKVGNPMISPVYQLNSSSQIEVPKIEKDRKPLQFPKVKLENLGHEVFESVLMESNKKSSENNEFNIRMTLGPSKKHLSREDYDLMIDEQTKGMKKSDLMVVPDMKKSGIEEDDSELNTERSKKESEDEFPLTQNTYQKEKVMHKTGSEKKYELIRPKSPESEIDINVDISEALLESREIYPNKSNGMIMNNMIMHSVNSSSNSFSISRFKAQFENSGPESFGRIKPSIEPNGEFHIQEKDRFAKSLERNELNEIKDKQYYEAQLQIKNLESKINELTKHLANNKQHSKNLETELTSAQKRNEKYEEENKHLQSQVKELQQKAEYESKINIINCEKLKKVSSELTVEKSRIRSSESTLAQSEVEKLRSEILNLNLKLKKANSENETLKEKLEQRDEIELQNEIRIQELESLLEKEKSLKNCHKISSAESMNSNSYSKITKKETFASDRESDTLTVNYFEEKIKELENYNKQLKEEQIKKEIKFSEKTLTIQIELGIVEKEFKSIVEQLIKKEKLLEEKIVEVELWKTKSHTAAFTCSAQQELKNRSLEEDFQKKNSLIISYEREIQEMEREIQKLSKQNNELTENFNKLMRESYRFEGELKVIKEEESFRESFGSSGELFKISISHGLTGKEEVALHKFKENVEKYNKKFNKNEKVDVELSPEFHDIRKKIFDEIEKATNIITELLANIYTLENEILKQKNDKVRFENEYELKLEQMQARIDELEESERISAGSSNIVPFVGSIKTSENEKFDQYSQATKKRSLLTTMNVEVKLTREIEKLKSIIYDKNKEISDLIASYEKLKLEKETQSMLMKSKRMRSLEKENISDEEDDKEDVEFVHDILDLQIRLNKEKEKKNLIMEELELRKSLNRSQELSQNVPHFDLSSVYKEIRAVITGRENYITTEETLQKLIIKINELNEKNGNKSRENNYKLSYHIEEKLRVLSKELQVMKSTLLKLSTKDMESMQCKTIVANAFKPVQNVMNELLSIIEQMISSQEE